MTSKVDWLYELPESPFDIAKTWLVVGSAGCGKSYMIRRTIDGLIENGVHPSAIMYILFNKEPADEFKAVYFARGYEAEDLRAWGTHHAVMKRTMKLASSKILTGKTWVEWGKKNGFDFSPTGDKTEWDKIFNSLSTKLYKNDLNYSKTEQRLLSALSETEVREGLWTHVRYLIAGCSMRRLPEKIQYIFVDEAQDNGVVQMNWLKGFVGHEGIKGIMLAGDDKQAINLFKGSDPSLFLDFPVDRRVVLRTTRRCPPNIIKEANKVVSPIRSRSPLADTSTILTDGMIRRGSTLDSLVKSLRDELSAGRNVLALTRDNYTKDKLIRKAFSLGLVVAHDSLIRLKKTLQALKHVHETGKITDFDMMYIVPSGKDHGQLKKTAYWVKGVPDLLMSGGFKSDPTMLEAYKVARYMGGLPLEDVEMLGFLPSFIEDVKAWRIPFENWVLSKSAMLAFKKTVTESGMGFGTLHVSTIHSVKGMEEDNVLLCTDVSGRTVQGEYEDPDAERRVWYVALTRTKKNLFITQIDINAKHTQFVW